MPQEYKLTAYLAVAAATIAASDAISNKVASIADMVSEGNSKLQPLHNLVLQNWDTQLSYSGGQYMTFAELGIITLVGLYCIMSDIRNPLNNHPNIN